MPWKTRKRSGSRLSIRHNYLYIEIPRKQKTLPVSESVFLLFLFLLFRRFLLCYFFDGLFDRFFLGCHNFFRCLFFNEDFFRPFATPCYAKSLCAHVSVLIIT